MIRVCAHWKIHYPKIINHITVSFIKSNPGTQIEFIEKARYNPLFKNTRHPLDVLKIDFWTKGLVIFVIRRLLNIHSNVVTFDCYIILYWEIACLHRSIRTLSLPSHIMLLQHFNFHPFAWYFLIHLRNDSIADWFITVKQIYLRHIITSRNHNNVWNLFT